MTKKQHEEQLQDRSEANRQPQSTQDERPGYGNKKLEGPDRPST